MRLALKVRVWLRVVGKAMAGKIRADLIRLSAAAKHRVRGDFGIMWNTLHKPIANLRLESAFVAHRIYSPTCFLCGRLFVFFWGCLVKG